MGIYHSKKFNTKQLACRLEEVVLLLIEYFMILQRESMTIPAERLNFLRFLSHFRSVHRGSFFTGMRTTTVRKLLPEYVLSCLSVLVNGCSVLISFVLVFRSWGFLCPVHTPDGTPCGLLNHLTSTCRKLNFHFSMVNFCVCCCVFFFFFIQMVCG